MPRQTWGLPDGVAAGSDVSLEAVLTVDGAVKPSQVTSSGAFTLSIDNPLLPLSPLLTDEPSDSFTPLTGLVKWDIASSQSSAWVAGTFEGDIKLVDSGGAITFWPVSVRVRQPVD